MWFTVVGGFSRDLKRVVLGSVMRTYESVVVVFPFFFFERGREKSDVGLWDIMGRKKRGRLLCSFHEEETEKMLVIFNFIFTRISKNPDLFLCLREKS